MEIAAESIDASEQTAEVSEASVEDEEALSAYDHPQNDRKDPHPFH